MPIGRIQILDILPVSPSTNGRFASLRASFMSMDTTDDPARLAHKFDHCLFDHVGWDSNANCTKRDLGAMTSTKDRKGVLHHQLNQHALAAVARAMVDQQIFISKCFILRRDAILLREKGAKSRAPPYQSSDNCINNGTWCSGKKTCDNIITSTLFISLAQAAKSLPIASIRKIALSKAENHFPILHQRYGM